MSRCSYLSYLRSGAATFIDQPDTADAPARSSASVALTINAETFSLPQSVKLFGPGDVAGLWPDAIRTRNPAPGSVGAEVNYFPLVEIAEADLPWRFTPAKGSAEGRLRPWLNLIVVEEQPDVAVSPVPGVQLPVIEVPRGDRPDLDEAEVWAHVQVTLPDAPLGETLESYVQANPRAALARLMSPRRMAPYTRYLACLVPTFEVGRRAGLGDQDPPVTTKDALVADAWRQVGQLRQANAALRGAQAARGVGDKLTARHLQAMPDDLLLQVAGPMLSRLRAGGEIPTMLEEVAASAVPEAGFEGAFRRISRFRGPHLRRFSVAGAEIDRAELSDRAVATTAALDALRLQLDGADPGVDAWWRSAVRLGAVDPTDPATFPALQSELTRRLAEAEDEASDPMKRLETLVGKDLKVLPLFLARNGRELAAVFAHQAGLLDGDASIPRRWLQDHARVRPGPEALDLLLTLSDVLGRGTELAVAHLPFDPGQGHAWAGDRLPETGVAPRLSLAAHTPLPVDFEVPLAGLMLDSWTDAVPRRTVPTGLAFNYDAPKPQAPQAILILVPPDPARDWEFEDLEATLNETFEAMRLRLMDPSRQARFGDYLPALYISSDARAELES